MTQLLHVPPAAGGRAPAGDDVVARILADRPRLHAGGELDWTSGTETIRFLADTVRTGDTTIETGCGVSTIIFAARGARHTTISPDAREHELVSTYCASIGVSAGDVTFIDGLSDQVLPRMPEEQVLDLAFIDGAHGYPFPAVDFHYISRRLKVGALLIVDDIPIRAVSSIYEYLVTEPSWKLERILDRRTAVFRLVAEIAPEDWTTQAFNDRPYLGFLPAADRARAWADHKARQARKAARPALSRAAQAPRARLTRASPTP
jgi:predicted O-methyltransferase YrrM